MKFSSHTVKKNAANVAGIIIVIVGFGKGVYGSPECPAFSYPKINRSELTFNYLPEDNDMITDPFGTVCAIDESLIPGQWSKETWDYYKQSEYIFHVREIDLLSSYEYDSGTSPGFRSARNFYSHCLNLDSETEKDAINSRLILKKIIQEHNTDRKNKLPNANNVWFTHDNYYVKHFGLSTFHHITKSVNKTENKIILVLAAPKFLIPKGILMSLGPKAIRKEHLKMTRPMRSRKRQAYVDYIHDANQGRSITYKQKGANVSEERQFNKIDEIIDFEINLVKIAQPDPNEMYTYGMASVPTFDVWQVWYNRQWMYHDVSIDREWKKSPILYLARGLISVHSPCKIDWTNRIFSLIRSVATPEESRITDATLNAARIEIKDVAYHLKLCALLRTTKLEVVADYIQWNNYRNGLIRTKEGFQQFSALAKKMGFDHIRKPRSLYCAETNVLKTPVHWALANQSKSNIAPIKEKIATIYKNVLMSLLDTKVNRFLFANSTLSNKKIGKDFLSMPINVFGDESWFAKPQDLDTDIPKMPETSTYFGWYIEQQKWKIKNALRLVNEPCSKTSWPVPADQALIFVTKTEKSYELFLTGAILQPPFFNLNQHEMLNYAGIGVEIAMILWNLIVFPVISDEVVTKTVNYLQKNCSSFEPSNVSPVQYPEFYKNVHRNIDPVEIALNAYGQLGHLYDVGRYGSSLQTSQKQAFVTAHIRTQCEKYKLVKSKLYADKKEIRDPGVYYTDRYFSSSRYRIKALALSRFFAQTFGSYRGCNGYI